MSYNSLSDVQSITFKNSTQFWNKISEQSSNKNIGFFRGTTSNNNELFIIGMHHSVQMVPFARKREELFSQTAKNGFCNSQAQGCH